MGKEVTSFPQLTTAERDALTGVPTDTLILNTTTNQLEKYNGATWDPQTGSGLRTRLALTTPITVAATTDFVVLSKLTTPGAVTVNLPVGATGMEYTIKDATGDALTNNITINANGADVFEGGGGSITIITNFGFRRLVFNGGFWYIVGSL